jgi:hypothetical protein
MTKQLVEGSDKDSLQTDLLVPNAKDVSTYPGNEEGSVQPTTVINPGKTGRANAERERGRFEEDRKHHKEIGS